MSNERISQANSQLERTQDHLRAYDRKIAEMRADLKQDSSNDISDIR